MNIGSTAALTMVSCLIGKEIALREGALKVGFEAGVKAYNEGGAPVYLKEKIAKFKKAISVAKAKRAEQINANRYEHNPFFKKAFDNARAEGRKMTTYEKLKAHVQFCVPEMLKETLGKVLVPSPKSLSLGRI